MFGPLRHHQPTQRRRQHGGAGRRWNQYRRASLGCCPTPGGCRAWSPWHWGWRASQGHEENGPGKLEVLKGPQMWGFVWFPQERWYKIHPIKILEVKKAQVLMCTLFNTSMLQTSWFNLAALGGFSSQRSTFIQNPSTTKNRIHLTRHLAFYNCSLPGSCYFESSAEPGFTSEMLQNSAPSQFHKLHNE